MQIRTIIRSEAPSFIIRTSTIEFPSIKSSRVERDTTIDDITHRYLWVAVCVRDILKLYNSVIHTLVGLSVWHPPSLLSIQRSLGHSLWKLRAKLGRSQNPSVSRSRGFSSQQGPFLRVHRHAVDLSLIALHRSLDNGRLCGNSSQTL